MPRNRFIEPEIVRLFLSDGDWIEVKRELNIGEHKRLDAAGVRYQLFGPPIVDWEAYHIGRAAVWLTAWSFRNAEDRPVELTIDAIRALDQETFNEIQTALTAHIDVLDEEKKTRLQARRTSCAATLSS